MSKDPYWLELENVEAWNNGKRIFNELNLKLRYYENTVILGPNGAGKTALISLINRNLYPVIKKDSKFKLFGTDQINIWNLRKRIGFVSSEIEKRITFSATVKSVIASGIVGSYEIRPSLQNSIEYETNILSIADKLQISKLLHIKFKELSEGERRQVLIARSLINKPKILILDEPTSSLDIRSRYLLMKILTEISNDGCTLIQTTHRVDTIIKNMNKVIMIKDGRIVNNGHPNKTLSSKNLSNLFETPLELFNENGYWQTTPKE